MEFYVVRDSFTLTSLAPIAVVSVCIAFRVIAIPSPRAKRNGINHILGFATQGTHHTAAGTGIIISGISVHTVGAVALLYSLIYAGLAHSFVAHKLWSELVPVNINAQFVVAAEFKKYGVAGAGGVTVAVTLFMRYTGIASLPFREPAITPKSTDRRVWSITFPK